MNVLIISTSDLQGGAAVAACRLMHALRSEGVNVKMVVRNKRSADGQVLLPGKECQNKWNFYWERGKIFLQNRLSRKNLFDVSIANTGIPVTKLPEFREADVVHLHWINQGLLSVNEIERIVASGKKMIWTLHDMWPFTGICHYAGTCSKYTEGCGSCFYLISPSENDLSHRIFVKKQKAYTNGKISFVACSNWLKNLAESSPLTRGHPVIAIPNTIDTKEYSSKDKKAIRKKMNLPKDKKIVLFAAVKTSDKRKGMDYLAEASRLMTGHSGNILFLVAGANGREIAKQLALPAHCTGYVSPEKMPEIYNAADLFVAPSLQENLPNTVMEAMACGTPCVGFNTGGIPEMIKHRQTGYVAEYKNAEDLAKGILWTLFEADSKMLSSNARKKVLSEYGWKTVAEQYLKVYEHI